MKNLIMLIMASVMVFSSCGKVNDKMIEPTEEETVVVDVVGERADSITKSLTLQEKVCQMMFVTGESIAGKSIVTNFDEAVYEALVNYPVGGVILFSGNIQSREQVINLIDSYQINSKIPLFVGVDEEGGKVARIGSKEWMGTDKIPAMKTVKSASEAYEIGKTLGRDLSGLHFNLDFAPVADVLLSDKNTEIGSRSFGTDPIWVGDMVSEVVKGLEESSVSSVLKHFPGHGSTTVDSHTGYSASYRTVDELRETEFIPFKKGIEAGCDFVMVSHMTLENAIEEKVPASLSKEVVEGLLKGELGFEGIVITDSLSMGAITKEYTTGNSAVMAINAGVDMLLMPKNVSEAVNAITDAVTNGEISEERIDESVRKIIRIKIEKGLM